MSNEEKRQTMGGKQVLPVVAKTIINFDSEFGPKLLCDRMVFSLGLSCVYGCTFCYVPSMMTKSVQYEPFRKQGIRFEDVVMRRQDWEPIMRQQIAGWLGMQKSKAKRAGELFPSESTKVIYASHLVDVAANMELVRETIHACRIILELTPWHIRLLSKSNLLPMVAKGLGDAFNARDRVIYGVSTGTLDDELAAAFELGTAKVSKRIESLHWLQDNRFRTFGMICPSLPQSDYSQFAWDMAYRLRVERCEHVWAEVINVRGESMTRTCDALLKAGFESEAKELARVSGDSLAWELYSRATFEAHAPLYRRGQLRFLQYVDKKNWDYWSDQESRGAVLLGSYAELKKGDA